MILTNFTIRDLKILRRFIRRCRSKVRKRMLNKIICNPAELTEEEKKKESIYRKHYILDIEDQLMDSTKECVKIIVIG